MGLVPRERRQIYLGRGTLQVFAVGEISLSLLKKKKERKEFSSTMNANGRNGILLAILR